MSNSTNAAAVVDSNLRHRVWHMDQIYLGDSADKESKSYAAVGDIVLETVDDEVRIYVVGTVDSATNIPTLKPLNRNIESNNTTISEVLFGTGPGMKAECFRCFIDQSINPYSLTVDPSLNAYGSTSAYVKIFLGTNTESTTGVVVSQYKDPNTGNNVENIPLAYRYNYDGKEVKYVVPASTTRPIDDGEVLTMVTYSAENKVQGRYTLLVHNTSSFKRGEYGKRYVTDIGISSPYISASDSRLIQAPIGITKDMLHLIGYVTYNDGYIEEVPINDGRMRLFGLNQYINTAVNIRRPLSLVYNLSDDEDGLNATTGATRGITKSYEIEAIKTIGGYVLRIYVIPVWDASNGWVLEGYLYSADRDIYYNITNKMSFGVNSDLYDGRKFGVTQYITLSVELSDIDPSLEHYRHVESIAITLVSDNKSINSPWRISYDGADSMKYGLTAKGQLVIKDQNEYTLSLAGTYKDKEAFLRALYYNIDPLLAENEIKGPEPTTFTLIYDKKEYTVDVNNWQFPINVGSSNVTDTAKIMWKRLESSSLKQLAITPIYVRSIQ